MNDMTTSHGFPLGSLKTRNAPWWLWTHPVTRFALDAIIVTGVIMRFFLLDRAPAFLDETHTLLRVAGHSYAEVSSRLSSGELVPLADLVAFTHINHGESSRDLLRSLTMEDAQHPPIFFLLVRSLALLVGSNSIAVARLISAAAGALGVGLTYLVGRELFGRNGARVAAALAAVAPFQFVYAREARTTSLLAPAILLVTWLFLRALRQRETASAWQAWALYAIGGIVGLYSHLFVAPVLFGHALFLFIEWWRHPGRRRELRGWFAAALAISLYMTPWLFVLRRSSAQVAATTNWMNSRVPFSTLLRTWVGHVGRTFVDVSFHTLDSMPVLITIVCVVVASAFLLARSRSASRRRSLTFLLCIFIGAAGILVAPDLILGGVRSTVHRYGIGVYVVAELLVAGALTQRIRCTSLPIQQMVLFSLLAIGSVSIVRMSESRSWWTRYCGETITSSARDLDRRSNVVVLAMPGDLPQLMAIALATSAPSDDLVGFEGASVIPRDSSARAKHLRVTSSAMTCSSTIE